MFKRLMVASAMVALLVAGLAVPASAADTEVFHLNAIPGKILDICTPQGEIVSNLKYKKFKGGLVDAATTEFKARVAKSGQCKGRKVFKAAVSLEADANYTFVWWLRKGNPALKVFKNDLGLPAADKASYVVRHVAPVKAVDVWIYQLLKPAVIEPTVSDLGRTQTTKPHFVDARGTSFGFVPSKPTRKWSFKGALYDFEEGMTYEVYLFGKSASRLKIATLQGSGVVVP